jgi:adenosylcobinamide kinase/adenosylcobinamide-phosphate guanylyltransferase
MDTADVWTNLHRADAVEQQIAELADAWSTTPRRVVAVSNDVGSGIVPADPGTRLFRDLMGRLNTTISLASDQVLWTIAGRTVPLT